MKPYAFLLALAVSAGTYGQSFECYPVGALPTALPSCEGVTSNNLNPLTGVSATPACGFPTDGAQHLEVFANGPVNVAFLVPPSRPISPLASEVRIPIPAGTNTVSFDWEFFNAEGLNSSFNDGMSIDIVTASGDLIKNIVKADTSSPLGPCASGGSEILPSGPQSIVEPLGLLPPGSYLSLVVWNGLDNLAPSHANIDDVLFTAGSGAQFVSMTNTGTGTFVDISMSGGTAITGVADDSEHNIVTTIGNALFPAGNVRIGNNGAAVAGVTTGDVGITNFPIPPSGAPTNIATGGTGYLIPFWDDLDVQAGAADTTIWWQETGGVLIIMWKDIGHFFAVGGQQISFQVQVFSGSGMCGSDAIVKYVYSDSVFGGSQASFDNGLSATIGYAGGMLASRNIEWSFDESSVSSGTVLTLRLEGPDFVASSPFGPGSLQLDYGTTPCASYVLAVTLNQGTFPLGWLFGVDIPVSELLAEITSGPPFVGSGGSFAIAGSGLPSGLSIYAVVLGFDGSATLQTHSNALAYTIP